MQKPKTAPYYLVALGILVTPLAAYAHARILSTLPGKGTIVQTLPSQVTLHFNEPLEIVMSKIEVKNKKTGEVMNKGKPTNGGEDAKTLQVALKSAGKSGEATSNGIYHVHWTAVSQDSHRMQGDFEFTLNPKAR